MTDAYLSLTGKRARISRKPVTSQTPNWAHPNVVEAVVGAEGTVTASRNTPRGPMYWLVFDKPIPVHDPDDPAAKQCSALWLYYHELEIMRR